VEKTSDFIYSVFLNYVQHIFPGWGKISPPSAFPTYGPEFNSWLGLTETLEIGIVAFLPGAVANYP